MTYPVFPTLPGRDIVVKRTVRAASLRQAAISGRETFQPKWPYPLYDIELSFNALAGGAASAWGGAREWQALEDFWKQAMFAPGGAFRFDDPNDSAVTAQPTGTGDGATTAFQLLRALSSFAEPVLLPLAVTLFKQDWQGNQLQYTNARTNLLLYAQDMTNAAWTASNATVTGAAGTAPDGTSTAISINDTSATQIGDADQAVTVANDAATYTVSAFVKAGGGPIASIRAGLTGGTAVTVTIAFDPATGNWTAGGTALAAAPAVTGMGSGWWRVSFPIVNNASGNTSLVLRLRPAHAAALMTPVNQIGTVTPGDAAQTGAQLFWGAQIEAGAAATSYIATTSAAVTVTDYALQPGGIVAFATPPASGAAISWSGSYAWLCRFADDSVEFDNFLYQLWELKRCEIRNRASLTVVVAALIATAASAQTPKNPPFSTGGGAAAQPTAPMLYSAGCGCFVPVDSGNPVPVTQAAGATVTTGSTTVAVTATPTITASAYSAGQCVGGLRTLTNAARANGPGSLTLQKLVVTDKSGQDAALDYIIFKASPTNSTFTDHATCAVNSADLAAVAGSVHVNDCRLLGASSPGLCQATNLALPVSLGNANTTLYAQAIAVGTPTYVSTSDLIETYAGYED